MDGKRTLTYTPRRDGRFEYIWEAMTFIEDRQCGTCIFSKLYDRGEDPKHAAEYPMCYEIEGLFILEEPMHDIDDHGDEGISCNRYQNVDAADQSHDDQGRLF